MWKRSLAVLPGIGVSLLPKLVCPMCWPAYAGLVSALGLGFLISTKYLLPLTVAFLALAAAVILTGKFYFDAAPAAYAGVGLLIAALVWNGWPRRAVYNPVCAVCVPTGAGFNERNAQGEQIRETQN
jgi:hypothetical protein